MTARKLRRITRCLRAFTALCSLPAVAVGQDVTTVSGSMDLAIGGAFAEGEYSFGKVAGLVGDAQGRIFVADVQSSEIRAFGPDGAFLFRVARAGQGPAEVLQPCCLAMSPDGLLWVRDTGNGRYGSFRVGAGGAEPVRTMRMQHGHGGLWHTTSFAGDTLVDVGADFDMEFGPVLVRYLVAPDGRLVREERGDQPPVRELGHLQLRNSIGFMYFRPPFGPEYVVAHGPGGRWAEAVTTTPEVRLHLPGGRVVPIQADIGEGAPLSTEEQEWAQADIEWQYRRARERRDDIPWEVPDRKQPIEAIFFDEVGQLWVQRSTVDGEPCEALVYSPEGRLVERRVWPAGVSLSVIGWAGDGWTLGVVEDEFDAESVVRIVWNH